MDLVVRVTDDLIAHGKVIRRKSGLVVRMLRRREQRDKTGVLIGQILPGMAAEAAGPMVGDIITAIWARPIRRLSDVTSIFGLAHVEQKIPVRL